MSISSTSPTRRRTALCSWTMTTTTPTLVMFPVLSPRLVSPFFCRILFYHNISIQTPPHSQRLTLPHRVDSEISDDGSETAIDETLFDRLNALRDIIPPKTRARISSLSSSLFSATSTTVNYSGKGLWVLATSILLLGIPYALALGEEQQYAEEERSRGMMAEGAQGMMQPGAAEGEAKAAL